MNDLETFFSVYGFYLWALLAAIVLLVALWVLAVQFRLNQLFAGYRQLMSGVDEGNLEDALDRQIQQIHETGVRVESLGAQVRQVEAYLQQAIQKVALVRFNPFDDTGGDQSFSVALLDPKGDGLVISSIFSRAATRVFAKPVQHGESTYTLSSEEQQAIRQAMAGGVPQPS